MNEAVGFDRAGKPIDFDLCLAGEDVDQAFRPGTPLEALLARTRGEFDACALEQIVARERTGTLDACDHGDGVELARPEALGLQPPAAPVEPTPPVMSPEASAVNGDLHWLVHQGHVLEFANGLIELAKKPLPKPPKPEPKKVQPPAPAPAVAPSESASPAAAPEPESAAVPVESVATVPMGTATQEPGSVPEVATQDAIPAAAESNTLPSPVVVPDENASSTP